MASVGDILYRRIGSNPGYRDAAGNLVPVPPDFSLSEAAVRVTEVDGSGVPTKVEPFSNAGGGGGGGGDASSTNQLTQINRAELTNTRIGDLTETAPVNDTSPSGLNGRLQRIAQRITTLIDSTFNLNNALNRFRNTAVTNTAVAVKTTPGAVFGMSVLNPNTSQVYLKLYDSASVTVGTTTPIAVFSIPAATSSNDGQLIVPRMVSPWISHTNSIRIAITTGRADNNSTAPATACQVQVLHS